MEKIADPDNLRLAYWKAQRGKSAKPEVLEYQQNLDQHLLHLRAELLGGNVRVGNYHYFKVYDPKERQICAAAFSERVLHHALMNVCHDSFEKYQIYDSYASRTGKGTLAALQRAAFFHTKHTWFMKLDIRKYFDSIDHDVLKSLLSKRFKDYKLMSIFTAIIDSYYTHPSKGLPIGNLTSQYFANHYLAVADHFVKEALQVEGYTRYMDDMVLWSDDKVSLLRKGRELKGFLGSVLQIELKPICLNQTLKGLPYLGYLLYPNFVGLNRNSRTRFKKKLELYENNLNTETWTQKDYQRHVLPLVAFVGQSRRIFSKK